MGTSLSRALLSTSCVVASASIRQLPLRAMSASASTRRLLPARMTSDDGGGRPVNLYGLDDQACGTLLSEWGQPKFRTKQLREWMYGEKAVASVDSMTSLPKKLRHQLASEATLGEMVVAHQQISNDGTTKRLWRCHDGALIESVLMPYNDNRRTACISSQVGCAMGCTFCATGQMGFSRDLTETEIFEQAARFAAELRETDERLSNVVFMGMGEPFRNCARHRTHVPAPARSRASDACSKKWHVRVLCCC